MKAPGWMEVRMAGSEHTAECSKTPHAHMTVRVKRWHPGFWLFVVRLWLPR